MKKLLITYHMKNRTEGAESCIELSMLPNIAEDILAKGANSDYVNPGSHGHVYHLLQKLALIQGYKFDEFCTAEEI